VVNDSRPGGEKAGQKSKITSWPLLQASWLNPVFAQLTGAYRLDDAGGDCRRCRALFGWRNGELHAPAAASRDLAGRLCWLRVVMLTSAMLTVTAAVLVGVFA
jgi:hypothetical protein